MTFPVLIQTANGQVAASLAGVPGVRVVGATRSQAIDGLKAAIEQRIALGELATLEIEAIGVSSLAGKYAADPTLRAISEEIYSQRNVDHNA